MFKKSILLASLVALSAISSTAQVISDPVAYVKNLMKKYSSESYFIIDQDDKSPRVFEFEGGAKMEFLNRNDLRNYIKSDQLPGIINDINTGVHETTHDFTSLIGYKILLEKGIRNIGTNTYLTFIPEKNIPIVVKLTKIFPASELYTVVEDDFQTERFATYVYPSKAIMGTQVQGIYGLLDEFHAYYHGTKAILDLKPYFENEVDQTGANWIVYFRNIYSTYYAYAEFKYFILKYLLYAKEKHPDMYQKILENKDFKDAFLKTDKSFIALINDFNKNKTAILANLKQKGMAVSETDEKITIDQNFAITANETYNFFMDALQQKEFTDMMALLSSNVVIAQNDVNTKPIKLRFDASSMAESFGQIKSVNVIGSFNDFDVSDSKYTMQRVSEGSNVFEITMKLSPGKYLYKMNIDGMFLNDMSSAGFMLTPAPEKFENDKDGGSAAVLEVN